MHGLVFYIGLGLGLALASGLRPYLPALLAGALARAKVLGLSFPAHHFHFLQSGWWLLAVTVALVVSYALQLSAGAERFSRLGAPAVAAQGVAVGALLFAGTLAAHGDASWPGLVGGALAAALAGAIAGPVLEGARKRLPDRAAREALTVYLDAASLALAVLAALLHPLGYVALALLLWFWLRRRARAGERYAGLRILGR
jgi:Domain of unknown function (DUF4126)